MAKDVGTSRADSLWPKSAVKVSPVEGVIEAFWNPDLKAQDRWRCDSGVITHYWDACFYNVQIGASGGVGALSRAYSLPIEDYERLRVRLRPGMGVKTTIIAAVDGSQQTVAQYVAESHGALEISGSILGSLLTRLTLTFDVPVGTAVAAPENEEEVSPDTHSIQLRWVMLERDGKRWSPPVRPFDGMLAEGPVDAFEPGLGLIFGADELEQMRVYSVMELSEDTWREDLECAAEQYRVDPASMIRPYSLYVQTRYGRPWDEEVKTGNDGLLVALIGMITRNSEYMRQAARYALAIAHTDEWAEGFVDRMPEYPWYHAHFAPNVATIKASLLLDWTWHWLSPRGRQFVRAAIRNKGLLYLDGAQNRMANQGVRFTKGLVLGNIATAIEPTDARLGATVKGLVQTMNKKIETIAHPDGTFSEGIGYGTGTMASLPIIYTAASRCLDVPVRELVSERFLPAMRFILAAERKIAPSLAAFCAGPLGDTMFVDQCVPTSVWASYYGPRNEAAGGNSCEFVFFGLIPVWSQPTRATAATPRLPEFSLFRDGGWVFIGNSQPDAPRISFESGLWDGHGHSWYHKHALTLDAWGEQVLLTRDYLSYEDARSRHTMSTRFYNTFAPAQRDQDATGTAGCGAELSVAEDYQALAIVESDNATAWSSNVRHAVRRALFVRPGVLIVQDVVQLDTPETGVQSWNSLTEWQLEDARTCVTRVGKTGVRLKVFSRPPCQVSAGQASVHRDKNGGEMPVYRAAITSPSALDHYILTIIETIAPEGRDGAARIELLDRASPLIDVHVGETVVRIAAAPFDSDALWECSTDGELAFAVKEVGRLTLAGSFGAETLETPIGSKRGDGFIVVEVAR